MHLRAPRSSSSLILSQLSKLTKEAVVERHLDLRQRQQLNHPVEVFLDLLGLSLLSLQLRAHYLEELLKLRLNWVSRQIHHFLVSQLSNLSLEEAYLEGVKLKPTQL